MDGYGLGILQSRFANHGLSGWTPFTQLQTFPKGLLDNRNETRNAKKKLNKFETKGLAGSDLPPGVYKKEVQNRVL